jgi:ATP-dependent helicase HrpB
MASQQWIVIADMTGAGPDLRITLAGRYTEDEALSSGAVETREEARYDHHARRVRARRVKTLGAIGLEDAPLPTPSGDLVRHALLEAIREQGLGLLRHGDGAQAIIHRVDLLSRAIGDPWPAAFGQLAMSGLEDWLGPQLDTPAALDALSSGQIADALLTLLDWPLPRDLSRLAPKTWTTPVGREVDINYAAEGGPAVECKVQEAFGLATHPAIADGRIALTVSLLSPAFRPVAVTRDVPGFWRGGYHDMKKDMKGRYPKHNWPDDPAAAIPTSRARPRGT